ncbi:glycosyl hydrolase [Sphaerisporangium melleum]|uniref:Glycosyl hydrolase n=1 Tax=Sphaerisporangium melleum TaxID=321316 RepID=A0A917R3P7_9ACTN|nr:family 10 glycosylhydrolase [Sphaerisporangium melleum]GGK87276.1 glycosyl hydrolase [Sphaerisporangium melleum]GII72384.1 glycosyl hydrolase [Sphaerisporangium melleum]
MRNGHGPLLVATTIAVVTTGVAYTFGPHTAPGKARAATTTATAKPSATGPAKTATGRAKPATTGQAGRAASEQECQVSGDFPKRQLRGVWIATVHNVDWPTKPGLTQARQQAEYLRILDNAVKRKLNAVFVQVRPASDAIYKSPYEPWSQWLAGAPGRDPGWEPLPFLIDEAHKRGLEFHAWFNPYRAADKDDLTKLPANHPARQHPSWVVKHEGRLYYNPGLPQVRAHTVKVVKDVVQRYDIDGVHFDDYFYPYPGKGTKFADAAAFTKYGKGMSLADWRRENVNTLVAQVGAAVHEAKPYVKFGISPFGIWRNKSDDPSGSDTKGLSAYDAIYADARAWIKAGSVDYIMPQLYWPRGFAAADYAKLVPWWANEVKGTGVHLYIGQALYRVGSKDVPAWTKAGELPAHLTLNRKHPEVRGDVYFSAAQLAGNPLGVLDALVKGHYSRPALPPLMAARGGAAPAVPAAPRLAGGTLRWKSSPGAHSYAVYRVADGKPDACATGDARNLVAVVPAAEGAEQAFPAGAAGTYLVSALDRLGNESGPATATLP